MTLCDRNERDYGCALTRVAFARRTNGREVNHVTLNALQFSNRDGGVAAAKHGWVFVRAHVDLCSRWFSIGMLPFKQVVRPPEARQRSKGCDANVEYNMRHLPNLIMKFDFRDMF